MPQNRHNSIGRRHGNTAQQISNLLKILPESTFATNPPPRRNNFTISGTFLMRWRFMAIADATWRNIMATPDRDPLYGNDTNRTVYTREGNGTAWFIGIIVVLALLAIGYLVFSANSGSAPSGSVDSSGSPAVEAPAPAPDTSTMPSTEAPAPGMDAAPMTPAPEEAAPAPSSEAPADTPATPPADSGAETPATPAPAVPAQ
jgi:hypothetical protein